MLCCAVLASLQSEVMLAAGLHVLAGRARRPAECWALAAAAALLPRESALRLARRLPRLLAPTPAPPPLLPTLAHPAAVEEASNAIALDGLMFEGVTVRIRRPADYNAAAAAPLGPSMPNPNLNLAAIGLDKAPAAAALSAPPAQLAANLLAEMAAPPGSEPMMAAAPQAPAGGLAPGMTDGQARHLVRRVGLATGQHSCCGGGRGLERAPHCLGESLLPCCCCCCSAFLAPTGPSPATPRSAHCLACPACLPLPLPLRCVRQTSVGQTPPTVCSLAGCPTIWRRRRWAGD